MLNDNYVLLPEDEPQKTYRETCEMYGTTPEEIARVAKETNAQIEKYIGGENMSQMAVCESCGERFDYGSGKIHTHRPVEGIISGAVKDPYKKMSSFRDKLEAIINEHSLENESDTPDYILADFMIKCLVAYDSAVNARRTWHSTEHTKGWSHIKEFTKIEADVEEE